MNICESVISQLMYICPHFRRSSSLPCPSVVASPLNCMEVAVPPVPLRVMSGLPVSPHTPCLADYR